MPKRPATPPGNAPTICPGCGNTELVRAEVAGWLVNRPGARCLVCGHRFGVSKQAYEQLRPPQPGEPFEKYEDFRSIFMRTPLTAAQTVGAVIGLITALAISFWVEWHTDRLGPLTYVLIATCMYAGWKAANWLFPPPMNIPGKCRHCGYDLRGTTSGRCPECGNTVEQDGM
ncbi:MAG: hypothetical protein JXO22_16385 [Phycisphaerae bacterium]|nr:hypothetical protein [Phycisphaerae bacterium]